MINYGKQTVETVDIQAVTDTLQSDWLTQGPKVGAFEAALAEYCDARFAVAVANGTVALHLANLVMDLQLGDGVITTPITFLATANAVIYCGGRPYFSDVDQNTINIDPIAVKKTAADTPGIKGIIPVHFAGVVADMEKINEIARQNDLWIIEDACHALGGNWIDAKGDKHRVGDCAYSDMTVFSFHPVKQITTGEGGAILTNNEKLYQRLLKLRTHGMTKDPSQLEENHGDWYYEMSELGYNYRITDIQCALGLMQLKRNDEWVARRRELVSRYDAAFAALDGIRPQSHSDSKGGYSYHLYVVRARYRKELYDFLKTKEINTQVHYIPVHLQPYYRERFGYSRGDFPIAEKYYDEALSLPLFPLLTDKDQDYIIKQVKNFYADT